MLPVTRPSLRGWFYGLCRALLGERCTIAPVALRMTDALPRLGHHITATLDAQTPGVRTTRFCRRAHPRLCLRWLACARHRDRTRTLSAPCRIAPAAAHEESPALQPARRADAVAATASQPASRDDRETPLVAGGMQNLYGITEFL